jgi:hypothetical protein
MSAGVAELSAAQKSLASLKAELEGELAKIGVQQGGLVPQAPTPQAGAPTPGDQPLSEAERKAKEAQQRFKKLCRDAKRRAIGAG